MIEATPETLAIAFGRNPGRPRLQRPDRPWASAVCFSTWIDPAFAARDGEDKLIREMMARTNERTGRRVVFEPTAGPEWAHVRIVLDGSREAGLAYAGLAYVNVDQDAIYGGEVVLHPDWVRSKVILHELAHLLGFDHPQEECRESVMAEMPIDSRDWSGADVACFQWMAEQRPGLPNPAFPPGVRSHAMVRGTIRIVD